MSYQMVFCPYRAKQDFTLKSYRNKCCNCTSLTTAIAVRKVCFHFYFNYRFIKVGKDLHGHQVQSWTTPLCQLNHSIKGHAKSFLDPFQESSLSSLFSCLTTITVKEFFLIHNLSLPSTRKCRYKTHLYNSRYKIYSRTKKHKSSSPTKCNRTWPAAPNFIHLYVQSLTWNRVCDWA